MCVYIARVTFYFPHLFVGRMAEEAQDLSTKGPEAKKSRLEENMAGNGDNNVASSTNGAATERRFAKFTMKR